MSETDKLIREFYDTLDTELSLEEVKEICLTPFKHLKEMMVNLTDNSFRLKYIGLFTIKPFQAKKMLKNLPNTELSNKDQITEFLNKVINEV